MVASCIDCLRQSKWSRVTDVVPGEADCFCARAAELTGAAVLSNDSDLPLHDLGNGCVVILQTLEMTRKHKSHAKGHIVAQCLRPYLVATRMTVPSLLRYGFERSKDPTATASVVKDRARDTTRFEEQSSDYALFEAQYHVSTDQMEQYLAPSMSLQELDPRNAEVVCQTRQLVVPAVHVYLPMLLEDPSRDAAWSYGFVYREVAYSVLLWSSPTTTSSTQVLEYARKGARVVANTFTRISQEGVARHLSEIILLLQQYECKEHPNNMSKTAVNFWLVALHIFYNAKREKDVILEPDYALRVCGYPPSNRRLTWDDVHANACLQSILYSLRILEQLLSHASHEPVFQFWPQLQVLKGLLGNMPCIDQLFFGPRELIAVMQKIPSDFFRDRLSSMMRSFERGPVVCPSHLNEPEHVEPAVEIKPTNTGEWVHPKKKRKRVRPDSAISSGHLPRTGHKNINSFDILQRT